MKNQYFRLAAVAVAGLTLGAAGCILGSDPNKNAMTYGPPGGTNGGAGIGGGGAGGIAGPNGPIVGSAVALFDSTTEGFLLDDAPNSGQTNLNQAGHQSSPPPSLTFDGSQGSPAAGSLSAVVPFSGANQLVDIQKIFGATALQNWSGKTLHVRAKVTNGTFRGGVQLFVKTGAYVFGGTYTNFGTGADWQEFTLNVDHPVTLGAGTYDPSQVISVGIELNSSSTGAAQMPVTINIDSFSVDPPFPAVDAGTDTGASPDAGTDTALTPDTADVDLAAFDAPPADTLVADTAVADVAVADVAVADAAASDAAGN